MNPLLPVILLLVNWSIDSTDPEVRQTVSQLFILVHVALLAVVIYLFVRIWLRNDTRALQVKTAHSNELQQMTVAGYDFYEWRSLFFTKLLLVVAVGHFVASRWGTPFPLLLQCTTNPFTVWRSPLFQLHVLGRQEEGKLLRPWKEESTLPEWLQRGWRQFGADEEAAAAGSPTPRNRRRKS
ncbi:hypothetical protein TcG_07350 [Trypanosoma cruzi]|uniref:Uncharacterized protein n=1 Tax=Trypanosoma cruzi TaxID=5693 RepID=A0A2V2W254_TRYCR|nr:hypothetical protein BCY84_14539 [Trypanosoma cruzi cruzi]PWV02700.1 hypothetical protein C4B63_2g377 [Trypanosoma cruzi]RNF14985.1 hypothetical protein TcG_07350 [Trypanosoma cruzi]